MPVATVRNSSEHEPKTDVDEGHQPATVQLKRRIGLLEGVAITVGSIIGSGIFVSPKGVILHVGSVGGSLLVWVLCGFVSLTGALCYAELGSMFPGSGGAYQYLKQAYGPVPAFLYLWTMIAIRMPCGEAILSLTFAKYVTQAFFPVGAQLPETALRLIAMVTVLALCFLNLFCPRWAVKAQNVFMTAKLSALVLIIIAGVVYLCQGNLSNLDRPFENTVTHPGEISLAFYSGFYSYAGWTSLNFLIEELKEPNRNLPRAVCISLPLVTLVYFLANVAYFAVLTPSEMLLSDAIAVTFGQKFIGTFSWIISVFVAISTCGALAIHVMTSSRLIFAGAREGHFPPFLSTLKISTFTPAPAIALLGMLTMMYLSTADIFLLISYCSYVDAVAYLGVVTGLLYMRYRDPNAERPIKVNLIHPIIYLVTCLFTATLPILVEPLEVGIALLISLTGLPVYYLFIARRQPLWLAKLVGKITRIFQKIFMALPQGD